MAAVSTVKSEVAYRGQLAAFSLVATAGVVLGVAALLQARWAASGLWALSWLGALYFFGSAALVVLWPFIPGTAAKFDAVVLLVPFIVAPFGVPFVFMARALKRIVLGQKGLERAGEA